ncbi:MAG: histidine phosphatase family protein [Alphaproteobacteria bacterium]|nr:histidine phosphatase family protein [Alphaproteobacteria bacterium]
MPLYFMKHGQSYACKSGLCAGSGSECLGLTEDGNRDCVRAAYLLKRPTHNLVIYTSPMRRCVESAGIVAETLAVSDPLEEEALTERHYGEWEGQPAGDHVPRALKGETPPGGESADDLRKRVKAFVEDLSGEAGDILLVSHPGVWKAILDIWSIDRKPWIQSGDVFALDLEKGTAQKL